MVAAHATLTLHGVLLSNPNSFNKILQKPLYSVESKALCDSLATSPDTSHLCKGGIVRTSTYARLFISQCRLKNTAAKEGGMIYAHRTVVFVSDSIITHAQAEPDFITAPDFITTVYISDSIITHAQANVAGGVIYVNGGTATFYNCRLSNSYAKEVGGVGYAAPFKTVAGCLVYRRCVL